MKLKTLTTLIIGVCFTPLLVQAQNEEQNTISFDQPLTLEECVQTALENNYALRDARLQEDIAETQVGETRAIGLPQASISSSINYNYEIQKAFLPNAVVTGNPDATGFTALEFSPKYSGNASFAVSQLLFDGSYFVGLQAAKTLRELRQKESNRSEIQTVEAVSKAYYTVLINQERKELLDANIDQLEKLFADTKALNENGFAENIDVDRIQVNLNNLKTENNKVSRGLNYAYNILKFQMGIPLYTDLKLASDLEQLSFESSEYLGSMADFDYGQRIEYQILNKNKELTTLDLKNNKISHLPSLNAIFNYGYNTGVDEYGKLGVPNNWLSFGAVGVSLNWKIFTGLSRTYKMEKNRIQLDQIEIAQTQLESSIDMEIKQLKDDLRSANEALEIQEENRNLANKVFEQTQIKYNNGVGSNTELIEAETTRKEAETNYFNALYDAVITKIELEKALGILY